MCPPGADLIPKKDPPQRGRFPVIYTGGNLESGISEYSRRVKCPRLEPSETGDSMEHEFDQVIFQYHEAY